MSFSSIHHSVLIGKESTWGTAVSPTKDIGLIIKDISDSMSREIKEMLGISNVNVQQITSGIVDIKQTMSGDFQHGRALEYVFGSVAHLQSGASSDWTHTFTVANAAPSATIESANKISTAATLTTAGMLIESAEISIKLNEVLQGNYGWVGKTVASTAAQTTPVASSQPVFPHAWVTVKLNGTTATEVQDASISIKKTISRNGGIGSNLYQAGYATELKCSFKATLGFEDKTYQELFLGGTSPSATGDPTALTFQIDATNGVTIGSGRNEVSLKLDNVILTSFDEKVSVGNITFIDIEGSGILDATNCFTVDQISQSSW